MASRHPQQTFLGESPAAQRVRDRLAALARLRVPVLIAGEPGSGRDTAARLLHRMSEECAAPFVRFDAQAAERGSALPPRGTVYLDGVEGWSPAAQRRFAALLAPRSVRRGRARTRRPRFVASSTPGLRGCVVRGGLDPALARSLLRFVLRLPPLRERPEDLAALARAMLTRHAHELGRSELLLERAALLRLRHEAWPGNLRELDDILEKLAAFAPGPRIHGSDVAEVLAEFRMSLDALRDGAALAEREQLVAMLQATGGNVTRTAERLGRSRAAVYRLVEKHGVPLHRSG